MTQLRILAAATTFATAFTLQSATADEWTGYTYSAVSTTAAVKGMNRIVERAKDETDGELAIDLHLGKTLQIASSDITQAVGDNIVQFAADLFFAGNVPVGRVLSLPLLIENDEEWDKAYAAMKPFLEEGFSGQGVAHLGGYRYPVQTIFATFEIDSLDDLKGRKIRIVSPEQGAFVEEFGGSPITLSGSEVPTALERGVIDGVLTASAGGAKNWHEFLPYNYRFPVGYVGSQMIANADAYGALDEETQKTFANIVAEEGPKITAEFIEDEEVQKKSQADGGMTITEASAEDVAAATEKFSPFWEKWAEEAGPDHVEALKAVRAALGK
ncbi:TRAP transporter substrate-binding protein DctP [Jiella avicenniae]|uniref:TRAP transporter substrate-binding protein DctP n=1 Tax=Jiella avicenniae TaxID=2907202 RepID=A0A9X1P5E6_9HYPH|nr:TRAP transporter substrate-binding protein DctP [Jiella avicenniae]MCE7029613.1 TRAP transporter substrate-binding protein DctP [Jiella avicenniae]